MQSFNKNTFFFPLKLKILLQKTGKRVLCKKLNMNQAEKRFCYYITKDIIPASFVCHLSPSYINSIYVISLGRHLMSRLSLIAPRFILFASSYNIFSLKFIQLRPAELDLLYYLFTYLNTG